VADWNSKSDCAKRIVIMTSRLLNDAHRYMLRCLSTHEGVQRCTVFTSISEVLFFNAILGLILYLISFFSLDIYIGFFIF